MADPVRILLLEDRDDDALLVERELRKTGITFTTDRAVDRASFVDRLQAFHPDLILSDHNLIGFNGKEALRIAAEVASTTPFIFVSGTIGEEAAIEALQMGATDYVIKDRLSRLVPVVQRALRESAARRERLLLEREFMHAQKMESLGQMAGSIAHDFNNLLSVMCGRAELLAMDPEHPAPVKRAAEAILSAGAKGQELTARLLGFARGEAAEPVEFDLNTRIAEFAPMFSSVVGSTITVTMTREPVCLPLLGNPGQIDQVLMNLLVNARDAMPLGGSITIATARIDSAGAPPPGYVLAAAGNYAALTVTDTGVGMSTEVKARMFDPFFTTKAPGHGTGLGLATVYTIVKQFGGTIQVDSEPGRGTSFRLIFRLADGSHAAAAARPEEPVLLVDDEPGLRAYSRDVLEAAGYRVVEAAGGGEALALLGRTQAGFSLLVTDIMMPDVDGVEVARRARALRPGLPIIFLSGLAGALRKAEAEFPGAVTIGKPYSPRELIAKVQSFPA
jgi:signal transduction histidine kinase